MGWPFKTDYTPNPKDSAPEPANKAPALPSLTDETVRQYARAQAAVTGRGRASTMLTAGIGEPMLKKTTLLGGY